MDYDTARHSSICPLCRSHVRMFSINLEEGIKMCENINCKYPFGITDIEIITVKEKDTADLYSEESFIMRKYSSSEESNNKLPDSGSSSKKQKLSNGSQPESWADCFTLPNPPQSQTDWDDISQTNTVDTCLSNEGIDDLDDILGIESEKETKQANEKIEEIDLCLRKADKLKQDYINIISTNSSKTLLKNPKWIKNLQLLEAQGHKSTVDKEEAQFVNVYNSLQQMSEESESRHIQTFQIQIDAPSLNLPSLSIDIPMLTKDPV